MTLLYEQINQDLSTLDEWLIRTNKLYKRRKKHITLYSEQIERN